MENKIKRVVLNDKGNSILAYIIVYPFIIMFCIYLLFCGAYWSKHNSMNTIVNKKLDRALVKGEFTQELKTQLKEELEAEGFSSDLDIQVSPSVAYDSLDSTYASRGEEIEIKVVHKKPHPFYLINKVFSRSVSEEKFYVRCKLDGMSERW